MWTRDDEPIPDDLPDPPCAAVYLRKGIRVSDAIASWQHNLRRYFWCEGNWHRARYPLSAAHARRLLNAKPTSPLWPILQGIPPDVMALAAQFGPWKHTALELLALTPQARQLAESSPNLFWLVCTRWNRERRTHHVVRDAAIFQMKRDNTMQWALGRVVLPSQLVALEKMALGARDREAFRLVRWFFRNSMAQTALSGVAAIHRFALEYLRSAAAHEVTPALKTVLAQAPPDGVEALRTYRRTIRDILRLCESDDMARITALERLQECHSIADLDTLHDDLVAGRLAHVECHTCRGEGEVVQLTCPVCRGWGEVLAIDHPFPCPPVPGNDVIVYVRNSRELAREGRDMAHCAGVYASACAAGTSFVYKVLAPERATLELTLDGNGDVQLEQVKGHANAEVTPATVALVFAWLRNAAPPRRGDEAPDRANPRLEPGRGVVHDA